MGTHYLAGLVATGQGAMVSI